MATSLLDWNFDPIRKFFNKRQQILTADATTLSAEKFEPFGGKDFKYNCFGSQTYIKYIVMSAMRKLIDNDNSARPRRPFAGHISASNCKAKTLFRRGCGNRIGVSVLCRDRDAAAMAMTINSLGLRTVFLMPEP